MSTVSNSRHPVTQTASCFDNMSTVIDSHHPVATTASCIDDTLTASDSHHPVTKTASCIDNMSTVNENSGCGGRQRKKYSEGSASTRCRIKSKAKKLIGELVDKYNEISKGEGWELFEDICDKSD